MTTHSKSHLNRASHATSTARASAASLSALSMERKPTDAQLADAPICVACGGPTVTCAVPDRVRVIRAAVRCETCAQQRAGNSQTAVSSARHIHTGGADRVAARLTHGAATVRDLAQAVGMSHDAAYAACKNLERQGLAEVAGKRGQCVVWRAVTG